MSNISNVAENMAAYSGYNTNQINKGDKSERTQGAENKGKTKVKGKTVGNPELSEKASKYYEELKKKYSNMDFILVSKDMKEQAKAQAGSYANPNKMVVLIDEDKIEKMAEDSNYRKQYEGVIANAASGMSQLSKELGKSGADVKGFGMQVNDNGTASYFAVLKQSSAAQKERIEKKAAERKEAKKLETKKKAEKKEAEKLDEKKANKKKLEERLLEKDDETEDTITITANSIEELLQKIQDNIFESMSDNVQTEAEKMVGQKFDFSV